MFSTSATRPHIIATESVSESILLEPSVTIESYVPYSVCEGATPTSLHNSNEKALARAPDQPLHAAFLFPLVRRNLRMISIKETTNANASRYCLLDKVGIVFVETVPLK